MASVLLHPVPLLAGPAAAATLWPSLLPPAPRRSFAMEEQLNQFQRWKLRLSVAAAMSQRSRVLAGRSSPGSSAGVAAVSRPAEALTAQCILSMTHCMDSVLGAPVVISGYWTGPDVEDGCGSVEAMLQRIV